MMKNNELYKVKILAYNTQQGKYNQEDDYYRSFTYAQNLLL